MSASLRVASLEVANFLGVREASIEPGKITVLEGRNGSGKSSLLAALQQGLGGGTSLARLAHVHADGSEAEGPELVIVLRGEGNEEYRVQRTGEQVRVKARVGDTAAFEDVGKPQQFLRSLYDPEACNPVAFLNAKDADRALLLLAALPLKLDVEALHKAMALSRAELDDLPAIPTPCHPLEHLSLLRAGVFKRRTGVNRDRKGKSEAAEQTRRNAPAVVPDDHRDEIVRVSQERDRLGAEIAEERIRAESAEAALVARAKAAYKSTLQQLEAEQSLALGKLHADHAATAAEIRAEAERRIALMAAGIEEQADTLRQATEAAVSVSMEALSGAQAEASRARAESQSGIDAKIQVEAAAAGKLAVLRQQADVALKARALLGQATQFDADAAALEIEADRLTAALSELDMFRLDLTKEIPIEGLEIEGKTIKVNGVAYDQLNTAQRLTIAVKVACLRARGSRLAAVFVDGAEALDSEQFGLLTHLLEAEGVQAFLARVTDDAFLVRVEGSE